MSEQPAHETSGITRSIRGEVLHKSTALVKRGLDLLKRPKPEDFEIAELNDGDGSILRPQKWIIIRADIRNADGRGGGLRHWRLIASKLNALVTMGIKPT